MHQPRRPKGWEDKMEMKRKLWIRWGWWNWFGVICNDVLSY